jgi:hypothetical protein
MLSGSQYDGVVRSPEHASWLQNVLDNHALGFLTKNASPLFVEAQCIAHHFQLVLDHLHEAEGMEDTVPEGDCEE